MIILIEIMKDKWKSLSQLDKLPDLTWGGVPSYDYWYYITLICTVSVLLLRLQKSTNQGQKNKSLFHTRK